jgi:hypothetical protein
MTAISAIAIAVPPGRALAATLVTPGADHALHIGLHQQLQHRLRHGAQEISLSGLLQQLSKRQSLLGHRVLSRLGVKRCNSTLAAEPDGRPSYTAALHRGVPTNLHHQRGR